MKRTLLGAVAVAGIAGAVAIPSIVSGNARRTDGSLAAQQLAETPFIAQMTGANEFPGPGDPDGAGAATISFAAIDDTNHEVCFDLTYTGIPDPTAAHIHPGAPGEANPPVVNLGDPPEGSHSGCVTALTTDVQPIIDNPGDYYVNVHTTEFPDGAIRGQLAEGPAPAGSMHFLPTPLRAYDSREAPNTILAGGENRTISLANGVDFAGTSFVAVPPGATAAIISLTATETGGPGFLTVYSDDSPLPATSNLNYITAGQTVAVTTQVAVDAQGEIKVTAGVSPTHFVVDVVGYLY